MFSVQHLREAAQGYWCGWVQLFTNEICMIQVLPVLAEGRIVGTGTTRPGGGTGDPGDHTRWRFFGGPELDIDAEKESKN